tara:strand:+ start:721 stop:2157 length:1437 start_codon:yes stop_codon:yes gene_type:complete
MTSDIIEFIFNNKIIKISNPDSNETILNFVRQKLKKPGTKEGCAEGGCGACTIVLGELIDNNIKYKAINACIAFLPTLNGKQLILVEDLISSEGKLHPVQKAMVKFHGSQCGFCTPGFVMSMFAMYKNNKYFDDEIINDSIAGNLCRCTGYRPIIDAAKSLNNKSDNDQFTKDKRKIINLLKKIKIKNIAIENENKKYFAPKKVIELKKLLKKIPEAKLLSGGTDLSLEVTKNRNELNKIIYLNAIKELDFIKKKNNELEIGAGTSLIKFEKYIKKYYPDFNNILKRYGSVQIRNVGTIAGNIATASPIGDTLPLLLSLDAKVIIDGTKGKEIISLNNFFVSYRKTKLKKGQFIYSVKIPIYKKNIFKAYKISKRYDDDISSVCGSFNIEIDKKRIKKIKIAYGGMSAVPKRAKNVEKILINSNFSEKTINKAINNLSRDFKPIDDMRASKSYRMEVAKNLLVKCFLEVKKKKNLRLS